MTVSYDVEWDDGSGGVGATRGFYSLESACGYAQRLPRPSKVVRIMRDVMRHIEPAKADAGEKDRD